MGTLKQARMNLKSAAEEIAKLNLIRGTIMEILIDLDGDKLPDVGLIDTTGDGNIDTLAVDTSGDNTFNLYFVDTDQSGLPDVTMFDEMSDGNVKLVGIRDRLQNDVAAKAAGVYKVLTDEDAPKEDLVKALMDLRDVAGQARKEFK